MTFSRRLVAVLGVLAGAAVLAAGPGGTGGAARADVGTAAATRYTSWAPAASAAVHPGTQLVTAGEQCTGNFVFNDAAGNVYLGYAAHCSGTGGQSATDGCLTGSVAPNTRVRLVNGLGPTSSGVTAGYGRLAYSSWITMHALRTKDADACAYNDFALVRIDPAYLRRTNPSMPVYGGPVALTGSRPARGAKVLTWGQSSLRPGSSLSAKRGASLGNPNDWSTDAYTVTPGIPGDSGSGFLDGSGRAFGVLSTIAVTPLPASNGVGNLAREVAFAQAHSGIKGLALVAGTERFSG